MSEAAPRHARDRLGAIGAPRASAIPEARRHTARVAKLRKVIVWASSAIVGLVLLALAAEALRHIPIDLRFAHIGMKGTTVTIEQPKLVGYSKDGRPYELRAKLGVQDITKPDIFDLEEMEVNFGESGDAATVLAAQKSRYNSTADRADLSGGVRIIKKNNYDLALDSAVMDFKENVMTSDQPAKLTLPDGEVTSKRVKFSQNERRATFIGNVHSVLHGDPNAPDEPEEAK